MMSLHPKIYIAGHTGLVGQALLRHFSKKSDCVLLKASRAELDLTRQEGVEAFFSKHRPEVVILAAGRIGGIQANSKYPADFIYQNLMIETNVVHAAWKSGVKKLINFGSSCLYPKECPQPMKPEHLMTGPLESTNEPYAIAKFAGMSLCSSLNRQHGTRFINVIPSNLYGPGDNFNLESCHVVAALIRKFHEAKCLEKPEVVLWGSGRAKRDFLFVDDLAVACEVLLEKYEDWQRPVHVGVKAPCTIRELTERVAEVTEFKGRIVWDTSKPDGALERVLDNTVIRELGWKSNTDLKTGLEKSYQWFLETNMSRKENLQQCAS